MKTLYRSSACLALIAAAACVQRAELRPIEPARLEAAGDTAHFGTVSAIDVAGSFVELDLRQDATVLFFKFSTTMGTTFLEQRQLAAGVHQLPPRRGTSTRLHHPTEALLVVLTVPARNDNDPLRGWRWGARLTYANSPWRALYDLPPTLMRNADQPWAAYLVDM